jgi:hypothetical protein
VIARWTRNHGRLPPLDSCTRAFAPVDHDQVFRRLDYDEGETSLSPSAPIEQQEISLSAARHRPTGFQPLGALTNLTPVGLRVARKKSDGSHLHSLQAIFYICSMAISSFASKNSGRKARAELLPPRDADA